MHSIGMIIFCLCQPQLWLLTENDDEVGMSTEDFAEHIDTN
jgi:hypothetical protein